MTLFVSRLHRSLPLLDLVSVFGSRLLRRELGLLASAYPTAHKALCVDRTTLRGSPQTLGPYLIINRVMPEGRKKKGNYQPDTMSRLSNTVAN